jgi:hypothetical protein
MILLHTDHSSNDLAMLRELPDTDFRKKELMEFTKPGDEFTFEVTNDMAESEFTRYLNEICEKPLDAAIKEELADAKKNNPTNEPYNEEDDMVIVTERHKNSLYIFRTDSGYEYPIQFYYKDPRDCGLFSDVEWVSTFYTPERGQKIIMDTFVQILERLFQHLDELEPTYGNLIVHFTDQEEEVVDKPTTRKLFNLNGTSLYYLQTNYDKKEMETTLDDLLLKPQMTFSCQVENLIEVLNAMIQPVSVGNKASNALIYYAELIQTLGTIVEKLCDTEISSEFNMKGWKHLETFQGYLWLFLFKIFLYYGHLGIPEVHRPKYFKNSLPFNSRHSNAQLYQAMTTLLAEHLGRNGNPAETLQKIILQPDILETILSKIENPKTRKNVFDIKNKLDKTNRNYGDPSYSLISYLEFFENPNTPNDSSIIVPKIKLNVNDWFHYSKIDIFSTQMEIKEHLVLVEVRCFLQLIVDTFIDELFPLKLFPKRDEEHVRSLTIGQLKKCVKNYRAPSRPRQAWAPNGGRRSRRTRKMQKFSKV